MHYENQVHIVKKRFLQKETNIYIQVSFDYILCVLFFQGLDDGSHYISNDPHTVIKRGKIFMSMGQTK